MSIYDEIAAEREALASHDEQFGGDGRGDDNDHLGWIELAERELAVARRAASDRLFRRRMVKLAALCATAIESLDRKAVGQMDDA